MSATTSPRFRADPFPHTIALADQLMAGGPDERFEFGLNVLISGLAASKV
jgi:hypothetical protein